MQRTLFLLALALRLAAADFAPHFEQIKNSATPAELYALLFALPNGADLHHHNGLSIYANVWYTAATSPQTLRATPSTPSPTSQTATPPTRPRASIPSSAPPTTP